MPTETQTPQTQTEIEDRDARIESLIESILQGAMTDISEADADYGPEMVKEHGPAQAGEETIALARWIAARIVDAEADEDVEHAIEMR